MPSGVPPSMDAANDAVYVCVYLCTVHEIADACLT